MNTLLQIKFNGEKYCFCNTLENEEKCQLCLIPLIFCDFEKDLNDNMMDLEYLQNDQSKLYPYLSKLFYVNKESICCFLDKEYRYRVIDQSGRGFYIFLSEIFDQNKQVEWKKLRQKFYGPIYSFTTA